MSQYSIITKKDRPNKDIAITAKRLQNENTKNYKNWRVGAVFFVDILFSQKPKDFFGTSYRNLKNNKNVFFVGAEN